MPLVLSPKQINLRTLLPALTFTLGFIIVGAAMTERLASSLEWLLAFLSDNFGAFLLLFGLSILFIVIGLTFTRVGDLRLGGTNAKPDFSYSTWFAIALNGCIGTGILFWAMGEPIFHMAKPPAAAGAEPFTREAAIFAVAQTFTHWTLVQYGLYTFCAVVVGILAWNFHRALGITTFLEEFVSPRVYLIIKDFTHTACICCIAGAVSCSMGVGIMQISSGLGFLNIIDPSPMVWFVIVSMLAFVYTISALLGVKRGLNILSKICTAIFASLMIYAVAVGPTQFIMNLSVTAFGDYLNNFVEHSLILPTLAPGETWSRDWDVQFTASFFVYAPILGLFLARLGKGRTIREFVWMNIFAPSVFCILWIGAWASMAVWCQWSGTFDIWAHVQASGMESTIFALLSTLPQGRMLSAFFLFAVFFSFATLADAITGTMAVLSTKNASVGEEPPVLIKALWGIVIAMISYVLIISGGQDAIRSLFTLIGLPMAFVVMLYLWYIVRYSSYIFGQTDRFERWRASGEAERWRSLRDHKPAPMPELN